MSCMNSMKVGVAGKASDLELSSLDDFDHLWQKLLEEINYDNQTCQILSTVQSFAKEIKKQEQFDCSCLN
jgi:hypothetical protein